MNTRRVARSSDLDNGDVLGEPDNDGMYDLTNVQ